MPEVAGERQRLFIGVPVAAGARDSIAAVLPASMPGRMVEKEKWHFTLRFLGSTESERIPGIAAAIGSSIRSRRFELGFSGLGAFPNPRRARVLWVAVDKGKRDLELLAAQVESAVQEAGFPAESRSFKAHLTIARIHPPAPVADMMSRGAAIRARMIVDDVILYRSHLGRGPSVYEELAHFPLTG